MRTLYIIRHAKSSWGEFRLPDYDRPLNERGKKDAPAMAKRLVTKKVKIDSFLSSPAKRARKTCELFCAEYGVDKEEIVLIDKLYLAPELTFFEIIDQLEDTRSHVAIFAHNPGVTDFVNRICSDVHIDEMPTCSVFALEINIERWKDFRIAEKKFLFFDYPKSLIT